jgi:TM2 domain-containing membrane protein YozV
VFGSISSRPRPQPRRIHRGPSARSWIRRPEVRSALLALVLVLGATSPASADEIDDFNRARNAWDTGNYAEAIRRFQPLRSEGPGALSDRLLIRDARVYFAASLVMERRGDEAAAEFERLLRRHPDYDLDPVAYPTAVVDVFRAVRTRIAGELRAQREREAEERRRREAEELRRREAEERRRLAASAVYLERVVTTRQAVFMAFPFGVGQFINGQPGKGVAFLVIESTLLLFNVGSFLVNDAVRALDLNSENAGINETIVDVATFTNLVSFFALVGAMGVGVVDAFLNFRREEVRWRRVPRRQVPDRFRIGVGPRGLALTF